MMPNVYAPLSWGVAGFIVVLSVLGGGGFLWVMSDILYSGFYVGVMFTGLHISCYYCLGETLFPISASVVLVYLGVPPGVSSGFKVSFFVHFLGFVMNYGWVE